MTTSAALRVTALILLSSAFIFAQPTETYNGHQAISNEIIVRTRTNDARSYLNLVGALRPTDSLQNLNQQLGVYLVHSPGLSVAELIATYSSRNDMLYAEPNYKVYAIATPNDPSFGQLWGMQKISAPAAWNTSSGGRSAVVGVVDTGISYGHPDLADNVWSAPTAFTVTVNGMQISCPAGSHGFNAITTSCDPADDNGHGTHVSGTIAAAGNNGVGVAGLNWTGSVMGLKFIDSTGSGSLSNALKAIEFAIRVKAFFASTSTPVNVRVLSNSWGGSGFSQALLDEINSAGSNDMLFVVAAGNSASNDDTTKSYPASYGSATQVTVAATDSNDALAGFSSYGPTTVHLGAPGVDILSTYLNNGYASLSGTSMATPHVAGAAMLVLSACPSLNTAALKNAVLTNVDSLPSLSGITTTGGRLNVNRAINSCAAPAAPALSGVAVSPSTIQSGQQGVITTTLTSAAGAGGVVVSLTSSYPAGVNVPATVTIPQGSSSATTTFTAGVVSASTAFTVTATYQGVTKTATGTLSPATVSSQVTFIRSDTTTQGNWRGTYGPEGYSLAGDATQNPTYVAPSNNGSQWIWSSSTTDVRGLQKLLASDRIAATWYAQQTFTIDLNFNDQISHQVAIYCVDWDSYGRGQTLDILDANNNVIDTRSMPGFIGGQYLVWSLSGHVKIRATAFTVSAVISGIFFGVPAASSGGTATFVSADTTTQGSWKGKYGSEGYSLAGDATQNPAYAAPSSNGSQWVWSASTTDVRGLQKAAATDRIAATWYAQQSFTIDLSFTDQNTHQVAIYCVDWDAYPRSQTIDILDGNNNVLDTRSMPGFVGGQYLVWSLSGHVKIRATAATVSAVISGIFFGTPTASSGGTATFLTLDTATQGTWKGKYGAEGYSLVGDATQNPSYVVPSSNGSQYTWSGSTTDVRALQKAAATDRIAATWYSQSSFTIDLNFTDQNTHQVAIYCVDWDTYGPRSQRIEVLDANNNVLDTRSLSSFVGGQYLVWTMSGHVKIRATALSTNAVISGIFFGTAGSGPAVSFVSVDSATQGNWKGKYGTEGYSLVSDATQNPSYVVPSSNGSQYTWSGSTTDVRALQKAAATDRVAATWYSQTNFTIDLNFTDQNTHQVAIYCVDWDTYGPRSQTIEVLDTNNTVIDTRTLTNFVNGQYLIWNMSGHVRIRATSLATNAVISGIFFR